MCIHNLRAYSLMSYIHTIRHFPIFAPCRTATYPFFGSQQIFKFRYCRTLPYDFSGATKRPCLRLSESSIHFWPWSSLSGVGNTSRCLSANKSRMSGTHPTNAPPSRQRNVRVVRVKVFRPLRENFKNDPHIYTRKCLKCLYFFSSEGHSSTNSQVSFNSSLPTSGELISLLSSRLLPPLPTIFHPLYTYLEWSYIYIYIYTYKSKIT